MPKCSPQKADVPSQGNVSEESGEHSRPRHPECQPCEAGQAGQVSGMEFSLQAARIRSRLKPELRTSLWDVWSSGMKFSLQAARSPGRLKPELRTSLWDV